MNTTCKEHLELPVNDQTVLFVTIKYHKIMINVVLNPLEL